MRYIILLAIFVNFSTYNNYQIEKNNLLGYWKSQDDKKFIIKIDKNKVTEFYDGKVSDIFNYSVSNLSCDTSYSEKLNKSDLYLKEYNDEDDFCYEIISLDKKYLSLRYTSNGKLNIFKKIILVSKKNPVLKE